MLHVDVKAKVLLCGLTSDDFDIITGVEHRIDRRPPSFGNPPSSPSRNLSARGPLPSHLFGSVGVLHGDLLYRDEFGYLYFSDRLGDTFRWRGENVSTAEVESVLLRIYPESSISVYGVPVPGNEGKAGMAAIVVDFKKLSEEEEKSMIETVYSNVTEHLPSYARPLFVRLCESIEMTNFSTELDIPLQATIVLFQFLKTREMSCGGKYFGILDLAE
ncbi:solute carrier family 27 (fatty acid transporter), member 1/4, partial [Paragonimus westermani]